MAKKGKKRAGKKASYLLITRDSPAGRSLYPMLDSLVKEHHEDLYKTNARIALAWNLTWKPDADGHVKLGQCKKASDLDRELHAFDFVIALRQEWFQDDAVTDAQRLALIDHELCHGAVKLDKDLEPVVDDRGRTVYRTVKHDIEEFAAVVDRHGIYKRDLERFAVVLRRAKQPQLSLEDLARDPKIQKAVEAIRPRKGSGIDAVTLTTNIDGQKDSVTLRPRP